MASRYTVMHHLPGFWSHVVIGSNRPDVSQLFSAHREIMQLFDVSLGDNVTFHWLAIVLTDKIILSFWLTRGEGLILIDDARGLPNTEIGSALHDLLYMLHLWFLSHFPRLRVDIVTGCQAVECKSIVDFLIDLCIDEFKLDPGTPPTQRFELGQGGGSDHNSIEYIRSLFYSHDKGPKSVSLRLLLAEKVREAEQPIAVDFYNMPPMSVAFQPFPLDIDYDLE